MKYCVLICFSLFLGCNTGELDLIAKTPAALHEVSGNEVLPHSDLIWMMNDSGNPPMLYGLNSEGQIIKSILLDAINTDWEDLTTDSLGNLYIGDFGNNNKNRKNFTIYKIDSPYLNLKDYPVETIQIELPKEAQQSNFEAFFLFENSFYIFSKVNQEGIILKVENAVGNQVAKQVETFKLKGSNIQITSADINSNGSMVVLLNYDKVWVLTEFGKDHFFSGKVKSIPFEHNSQKEGICFKNDSIVIITDERKGIHNGAIYEFKLN